MKHYYIENRQGQYYSGDYSRNYPWTIDIGAALPYDIRDVAEAKVRDFTPLMTRVIER